MFHTSDLFCYVKEDSSVAWKTNPYPDYFFCPENVCFFTSAAYIFMGTSDQIVHVSKHLIRLLPSTADLGPYCLQYRLATKEHKQARGVDMDENYVLGEGSLPSILILYISVFHSIRYMYYRCYSKFDIQKVLRKLRSPKSYEIFLFVSKFGQYPPFG